MKIDRTASNCFSSKFDKIEEYTRSDSPRVTLNQIKTQANSNVFQSLPLPPLTSCTSLKTKSRRFVE
ncbi:hypothetical protein RUM44_002883 [Polyplax serrata]|uniref:Uncharacterized protein n=1 Tax=Polyplax serrata TaxID=468196 RepID=A0ABR1AYH4_POLSC